VYSLKKNRLELLGTAKGWELKIRKREIFHYVNEEKRK
jgi:hypothetical protein